MAELTDQTEATTLPEDAQKRVWRAVETARKAVAGGGLVDIHLKRFHRAMDDLRSPEEQAAVHAALCYEPWYIAATETRKGES